MLRPERAVRGQLGSDVENSRATVPQRRVSGAERRDQIARATLRLIAEHGLAGVSMDQIAGEVGISNAALYRHFGSRDDILIAAYDAMAKRVFPWISSSKAPDAVQRLREVCLAHAELFSKDIQGFNAPMFQFIVWIPKDRIRAHVDKVHRTYLDAFVEIVEEGKAQGSVRMDIDSELVVSELYAWFWWEDLSYLAELDTGIIQRRSAEMLNRILREIAVQPLDILGHKPESCH